MRVLRRIVQLQPDNPFFRVNAVGILAYDVVADMDPAEREPFISAALSILDEGLRSDPGNPYLNYETGKIHLLKLDDPERARHYFRIASGAEH